jgi:archaellin
VSNAVSGEPVDLTAPYTADDAATDPDIVGSSEYKTVISYTDKNQYVPDVPWSIDWVGNSNSDSLLEEGEKAEITVWLLARATGTAIGSADSVAKYAAVDVNGASGILYAGTLIGTNDKFTIEVKPESGAVLTIQRTAPSRLDTVMDLK